MARRESAFTLMHRILALRKLWIDVGMQSIRTSAIDQFQHDG
jgi:hypothetical protein